MKPRVPVQIPAPGDRPRRRGARDRRGINLFCDNLRAYLDGRPLTNVVDWADGY
jgi:hypothetical protein